jgi:hypothetical protein
MLKTLVYGVYEIMTRRCVCRAAIDCTYPNCDDGPKTQNSGNTPVARRPTEAEKIYLLEQQIATKDAESTEKVDGELDDGILCHDCMDTGWLENSVEGRYVCPCIRETEPYQKLEQQLAEREKQNVMLRDAILAVCCDPEGTVCIHGSDGDRAILQEALDATQDLSGYITCDPKEY